MGILIVPFMLKNQNLLWTAGLDWTEDSIWLACRVFMGYLLNDFVCLVVPLFQYATLDDMLYAGHHLCLLATWSSFRIDDWGHLFAVPTMLTELTAPFINLRVFLNHFSLDSTTVFKVNGLCAILSWYYLRQWVYCTILSIRIWELRDIIFFGEHVLRNAFVLVCFLFGVALQCFWCFLITKGAISVVTGGGKKKKKDE